MVGADWARLAEEFERDGVVCVRGAFSSDWLEVLAAGVERNLREPGPYARHYTPAGSPGFFFGDYCNWTRIPEYRRFLLESPAAELAGRLMRSRKVHLFHEHVLVKEPGTQERTPWHHDQPYWSVDGRQVCSIWLPLDPVPQATCMECVPGSHRWGHWYTPRRFADNTDWPADDPSFQPVPDVEARRAEFAPVAWDLEPGDCLVFHALTLHGAPGNPLSTRRRVVASRWTGDDARFALRPGFMSPPPPSNHPPHGAPMESEIYPLAWELPPAETG